MMAGWLQPSGKPGRCPISSVSLPRWLHVAIPLSSKNGTIHVRDNTSNSKNSRANVLFFSHASFVFFLQRSIAKWDQPWVALGASGFRGYTSRISARCHRLNSFLSSFCSCPAPTQLLHCTLGTDYRPIFFLLSRCHRPREREVKCGRSIGARPQMSVADHEQSLHMT